MSIFGGQIDFLQEINGVAADGGYVDVPETLPGTCGSAKIAPPAAGRLMMGNDRPSGERVALLLTHASATSDVNPLTIGGYVPNTRNYLLAFRTEGTEEAANEKLPAELAGCCTVGR